MRNAALLVAVIGLAVGPLATRGASAGSEKIVPGPASNVIQVAAGCGGGYHWVGGHRDATGRWVAGHCVRN